LPRLILQTNPVPYQNWERFGNQLKAVSCQLSAVSHQLSAVSYQQELSVIRRVALAHLPVKKEMEFFVT
jgi:hypothetical protein